MFRCLPPLTALPLATLAILSGCSCGDGTGLTVLSPKLQADAARIEFADTFVGGTRTASLVLSNPGTGPVHIDAPSISAPFDVETTPDQLAAGAFTAIVVRFQPDVAEAFSAQLTIRSDAEGGVVVIELVGVGLPPLECGDDNACTNESFEPNAGICVRTNRDGPCDDESACTENDRCVDGSCSGDALACADAVTCTRDVCDPREGCLFLPDDAACADSDPCTVDTCTAGGIGSGCSHPPAPDGTLCGEFTQCGTMELCLSQLCVEADIPDGAPCFDGDPCTSDDLCNTGECVGTPTPGPATVLSETTRYLAPGIFTRIMVLDDLLIATDRFLHVIDLNTRLPVGHLDSLPLQNVSELAPRPTGAHLFVLDAGNDFQAGFIVDVTDAAGPTALPLPIDDEGMRLAGVTNDHVFLCGASTLFAFGWTGGSGTSPDDGICDGDLVSIGPGLSLHAPALGFSTYEVFTLDDDGAHRAGDFSLPDADVFPGGDYALDGSLLAVLRRGFDDGFRIDLVDLSTPAAPVTLNLVLPPEVVAVTSIALRLPFLYVAAAGSVLRLDVTVPQDATLDDWSVPGDDLAVFHADAERALALHAGAFRSLRMASVLGSGAQATVALDAGRGGIEMLFGAGLGDTIAVGRAGVMLFQDGDVGSAFPLTAEMPAGNGESLLLETSAGAVGVYSSGLWTDRFDAVAGPLTPSTRGRRADERAALIPQRNPVTLRDIGATSGTTTATTLGPLPTNTDALRAIGLESCTGAGVAFCSSSVEPPSACTSGDAQLVILSACSDGADLVVDDVVLLALTDPDDIVSASADGERVAFLGTTTAVLLDVAARAAIEVPLPELDGALFASTAFEDDHWIVVATYGDGVRPARGVLFDTAGSGARIAAFDIGEPGSIDGAQPVDLARRVLGIVNGFAYVSDWAPAPGLFAPAFEHGVLVFDLSAVPPFVVDAVPLASEPVDMVTRESGAIIGRIDGVSVVAPFCGP